MRAELPRRGRENLLPPAAASNVFAAFGGLGGRHGALPGAGRGLRRGCHFYKVIRTFVQQLAFAGAP